MMWVQSQQQALQQRQQVEEQEQQSRTLESEREKLLDALPDWRDSDKARAEKAKIVEYATGKLGFSAEEISDIYDARAVVALRKAWLFDELMSKRDKMRPTIQQKAKPMKGGTAGTPQSTKVRTSKDALSRLAKSGSTRDAAAVFEQFID
jgi:TolA-binding protein